MTKEEAIKKIKEAMPTMWKETKDAVETLVPELAESEDERIRKVIVKYFKELHVESWINLEIPNILAWLEKQKETGIRWFKSDNVKNPDKPHIDKTGMFYTTDGRMCYASEIEKQKEQKHPNGCFTCDEYKKGYEEGRRNGFTAGYNKAMKEVEQKEQKPSGETNVEPDSKIPREEYLYHLLANHIITFTDYTYLLAKKPFDYECANIPQKDYTPVEQKSADLSEMMVHKEPYIAPVPTPMVADEQKPVDYEAELKKCKDNPLYFYDKYVSIKQKSAEWDKLQEVFRNINEAFEDGKKEVVEHPKKYGLCKPTEWSEEDERMLSRCIKSIETSKQFADSDTFKVAKDKEINWLRALAEKMGFHKCKIGEIVTE